MCDGDDTGDFNFECERCGACDQGEFMYEIVTLRRVLAQYPMAMTPIFQMVCENCFYTHWQEPMINQEKEVRKK